MRHQSSVVLPAVGAEVCRVGAMVGGKSENDAKIIETCIADFLLPV